MAFWISDIIMPIISSLIGGTIALTGVLITLWRDRKIRIEEERERSRPYFGLIEDMDTRVIELENHIFSYDSDRFNPTKDILS